MAECVDSFIFEQGIDTNQLGFAFSFPVQQTAIDRGKLIRCTKGFACENAIQKDVMVLLQDAFLPYFKKLDQIKKEMVVNIEWGAFDPERRILPYTIYDYKLNREPDQQPFEKIISNLYLGEIVCSVILSLVGLCLIFSGQSSQGLKSSRGGGID
ncbi:unnamed protein product [Rhizopus stolonifer]